jgi:hypothetical protein
MSFYSAQGTPTSRLSPTPPPQLNHTQTQTPPLQTTKNYRDSPTQTPFLSHQSSTESESQTKKVYSKNIGVETSGTPQKSIGTLMLPAQNTVALDTEDLKKPTPLSVEFQYCIGHESEHQYEELPDIGKHYNELSSIRLV